MNRNRRLLLAVAVLAVLLTAASAAAWRSLAAPPASDPATARRQSEHPEVDAPLSPESVPGGPGFFTQSAFIFRPMHPADEWDYSGPGYLMNPGSKPAEYSAPLSLPHGARVTKLVVWYYDDVASDLTVEMDRLYLGMPSWDQMAAASSSGTPGWGYAENTSVNHAVIDLQNFAYRLHATIPGGHGLSLFLMNIRIDYEYSATLPLVISDH